MAESGEETKIIADRDAEIERLHEDLEQMRRSRSFLLGLVGHDLRTPLNVIHGFTQILLAEEGGPLTETQQRAVSAILRSERQLISRIEQMRAYARVMVGDVRYDLCQQPLHANLLAIGPRVNDVMRAHGVQYDYMPTDRGISVYTDSDKLLHILLRLVHNAARNTEPGGAIQVVGARGEHFAEVVVSDTGKGFTPAQCRAVFDVPDLPGDHSSNAHDGLTLGLATCRAYARGMGGELVLQSARYNGSRFTLTLPLYAPAA